jgi:glycosyltransferase involved in cell wall biosynthesis
MTAAILTLGLYRSSGGPSKSIRAFAAALEANVVSWVDPIQYERERLVWDSCTVVRGQSAPLLRQLLMPQPADAREAERLIALSEMVSCHSFWRWHNVWLARVAKRHRLPYWFVPHGGLDPYVFSSGRLAKRMFIEAAKPFFDNAAAVVCATRREYEKLATHVPAAEAIVLPWPLDDADFHRCDPAARTAVRRGLGIPEEAFCLLSFGRLDPMKRPLETIDAVAEVGLPDVHLIVMGNESGVSIVECEQRADKRGLRGRVHVVGAKYGADKTAHLDAADAYISLSHRENFNFTAAECLAAGLPVILSPGNDLAGELAAVDCGVMLEAVSDAPGGIDRLSRIGMAQRERLGENGRRWAEANLRAAVFRERIRSHAAAVAARRG